MRLYLFLAGLLLATALSLTGEAPLGAVTRSKCPMRLIRCRLEGGHPTKQVRQTRVNSLHVSHLPATPHRVASNAHVERNGDVRGQQVN